VDVVTHNAMAIISYNKESDDYSFQSYLQNGRKGELNREGNWNQFFEMTLNKV